MTAAVLNPVLTKRIIPLFLLRGDRLVKGARFDDFVDVGDPVSQAMIFDAQGADELAMVDIDASREGRLLNPETIRRMIMKCNLPIAVGGGIRTVEDARTYFIAGADKIIVNTQAVLNPGLLRQLSDEFGAQSVLASIDVKCDAKSAYSVYVRSGTQKIETPLEAVIESVIENGAGELMVTAIDQEGGMAGLDVALYQQLRKRVPVPLIASGGAGSYDDMVELFKVADADACALGTMLFLRDYDIVRIKSYLGNEKIPVREA